MTKLIEQRNLQKLKTWASEGLNYENVKLVILVTASSTIAATNKAEFS